MLVITVFEDFNPSDPVYRKKDRLISMKIILSTSWYLRELVDFLLFLSLSKMISIWNIGLH